jgi:hypothetical protein
MPISTLQNKYITRGLLETGVEVEKGLSGAKM